MSARPPPDRLLLALAYLGFVSLGLPDAALGIVWPSVRTAFAPRMLARSARASLARLAPDASLLCEHGRGVTLAPAFGPASVSE